MTYKSLINVPVPTQTFLTLSDFLKQSGSNRDPVEIISTAIDYWMDNAEWKKEDLLPDVFDQEKGYRWKQVFLPHGSMIRMKYKGQFSYAKVEGDKIIFENKEVSPSEFANTVTGTHRNAWRDLEVKRPSDTAWQLADLLRAHAEQDIEIKTTKPEQNINALRTESKEFSKYSIDVQGDKIASDTLPDLLAETLRMLQKKNEPHLYEILENLPKRGKRPYISKNRTAVYPGREDLLESHPPVELEDGYYIGSNIGVEDTLRTIRAACEALNLKFDRDVIFNKSSLSLDDLLAELLA